MDGFGIILGELGWSAVMLLGVFAYLAGLVRGMTGFGTALVYIPLASTILDPVPAIATLLIFDILGPAVLLRRCVREADLREVGTLGLGVVLFLPLGVYALLSIPADGVRWFVSLMSFSLVAILMTGWRYRGAKTRGLLLGVGATGGFLGGFVGIPGPPAILFYLAGKESPTRIRANTMLYLVIADAGALLIFMLRGMMGWSIAFLGLILTLPAFLGALTGQAIFNPKHEMRYRYVAYLIIAASATLGLPLFSG